MTAPLTARASALQSSPTLAFNAKVNQLKTEGREVINLSLGELDFSTPENIKQAAIQAIKDGKTRYTPASGILPLREALVESWSLNNQLETSVEQIIVGVGAKQLLYEALMVLVEAGDEVIVPVPTWSTYIEQIKLAGAEPHLVKLPADFKVTADQLEKAINQRTKVIMLNSPSNPTGQVIEPRELEEIGQLALKHDLFIISDEIYEDFVYQSEAVSIASLDQKFADRTVTIDGVSKAYAMTGWRIGYATGPREIIVKMGSLQSQLTSNACSIAQWAALEAVTNGAASVKKFRQALSQRRQLLKKALPEIPGLSVQTPEGAFYFFISLEETLNQTGQSSVEWSQQLLGQTGVAVTPGEAFLAPGYFRLSYAAGEKELKTALTKLKIFQGKI